MKDMFDREIRVDDFVIVSSDSGHHGPYMSAGKVKKVSERYISILILKSNTYAFRNGRTNYEAFQDEQGEWKTKITVKRERNSPYLACLWNGSNICVVPENSIPFPLNLEKE